MLWNSLSVADLFLFTYLFIYFLVHAFITSRVDYCNSGLDRVSAANVQPLQNVLNATARMILHKRTFDHITTDIQD